MEISENLQKGLATIIGIGFISAMVIDWISGFRLNVFESIWFWLIAGPFILVNIWAVSQRAQYSKQTRIYLIFLLALCVLVTGVALGVSLMY